MTTASREYRLAVVAVAASGLLWATGPVFVKSMRDPARYIRQYLWIRMGVLVVCYASYLTGFRAFSRWRRRRRRRRAAHNVATDAEVPLRALLCLARLSPVWRLFGVLGMATAMGGFVISLTMVPAAATLCELAASPFFAALLGRVLLGERVSWITWLSMVICAGGIIMFAFDEGGSPVSASVSSSSSSSSSSVAASAGFACYTVTLRVLPLRHRQGYDDTDVGLLVRLYGLIFSMWAAFLIVLITSILMLLENTGPFEMPGINVELSAWHGVFIFVGFCLFTVGAAKLPAPELILLTMLEVVGGILLTYFVLGELPGSLGLVGGCLIVVAVLSNGIGNGLAQHNKQKHDEQNGPKDEEVSVDMVEVAAAG
jgi:drug/metabolite transporter (DMT)-like permease